MSNAITLTDLERALLLIPIVMELGTEGAKRFILSKSLTDEELIDRALEFQVDTKSRNDEFRRELEAKKDG